MSEIKVKYSKAELEQVIEAVKKADNSNSMYPHSWARCAKILASECIALRAENKQLCALLAEKYEIYLLNCAEIDKLRAELEAKTKAVEEAREVFDDMENTDGSLSLTKRAHRLILEWLTAHPREEQNGDE